jgi:glycosyltransferase involved in cell wall biosynthesis
MEQKPRVTVLMSVYNGERFLAEALESILAQTWTDFEFLIINDGSTDRSRKIILSYGDPRIRLLDNPTNIGLTKSLNRGLELARGDMIARQDADDLSHPARLSKQVAFLEEHPEVALLGTRASLIDAWGRYLPDLLTRRATTANGIKWQLMVYTPFVHTSVMFRREIVWTKLGGYKEDFKRRQDYEFWSRIAAAHAVANLPENLVKSRIQPDSLSANSTPADMQKIEVVLLQNIRRYLGNPEVPMAWAKFIAWMLGGRSSDPIEKPSDLIEVITAIWQRFLEINPQALGDHELRSLLACDLVRAALILAPRQRWASLRAFAWAFQEDEEIAASIATKYLALLFLGEPVARAIYSLFQSLHTFKRRRWGI